MIGHGFDGCRQCFRNFAGDVVLNHQNIVKGAVVGFRPDDVPVVGANHARIDPQAGRRVATASGQITGPDGTLFAHATTTCLVFEASGAKEPVRLRENGHGH